MCQLSIVFTVQNNDQQHSPLHGYVVLWARLSHELVWSARQMIILILPQLTMLDGMKKLTRQQSGCKLVQQDRSIHPKHSKFWPYVQVCTFFYCIFVQFMQFLVLDFGLVHSVLSPQLTCHFVHNLVTTWEMYQALSLFRTTSDGTLSWISEWG